MRVAVLNGIPVHFDEVVAVAAALFVPHAGGVHEFMDDDNSESVVISANFIMLMTTVTRSEYSTDGKISFRYSSAAVKSPFLDNMLEANTCASPDVGKLSKQNAAILSDASGWRNDNAV